MLRLVEPGAELRCSRLLMHDSGHNLNTFSPWVFRSRFANELSKGGERRTD
jgi:hypothetical protein